MPLSDRVFGYLSQLPIIFLLFLIIFFPLLFALDISFRQYNLTKPGAHDYIGFTNYYDLITNQLFLSSWVNTVIYTISVMVITLAIGIGGALILNEKLHLRGVWRALILIPWAMPAIVSGILWRGIFDGSYGVLNYILLSIGIIGDPISWTGQAPYAMFSVILATVWREVPFATLLILAGIQSVPSHLYEVAIIEGANAWNRFRHVTLPLVKNVVVIVLIFETMETLKLFDFVYALTKGGPAGTTSVISYWTYQITFGRLDFGKGAALSYLMAIVILAISLVYIRSIYRKVEY